MPDTEEAKLGGKWEDYFCRGEIIDYSLNGDILEITQCTAWCEQEGVRRIIQEKFPSIKVYYREEEPGCDVYYTNDTTGCFFPETYLFKSLSLSIFFMPQISLVGKSALENRLSFALVLYFIYFCIKI